MFVLFGCAGLTVITFALLLHDLHAPAAGSCVPWQLSESVRVGLACLPWLTLVILVICLLAPLTLGVLQCNVL